MLLFIYLSPLFPGCEVNNFSPLEEVASLSQQGRPSAVQRTSEPFSRHSASFVPRTTKVDRWCIPQKLQYFRVTSHGAVLFTMSHLVNSGGGDYMSRHFVEIAPSLTVLCLHACVVL